MGRGERHPRSSAPRLRSSSAPRRSRSRSRPCQASTPTTWCERQVFRIVARAPGIAPHEHHRRAEHHDEEPHQHRRGPSKGDPRAVTVPSEYLLLAMKSPLTRCANHLSARSSETRPPRPGGYPETPYSRCGIPTDRRIPRVSTEVGQPFEPPRSASAAKIPTPALEATLVNMAEAASPQASFRNTGAGEGDTARSGSRQPEEDVPD